MSDNHFTFSRQSRPITPSFGESLVDALKKSATEARKPSSRKAHVGRKYHPFDMNKAIELKDFNIHHSTCIETKRDAMIGLGFVEDKVNEVLDPLCEVSFHHVLNDMVEDYWQTGNSYIEVVRENPGVENSPILALYPVKSSIVYKNVPDPEEGSWYWEILNEGDDLLPEAKFAQFGDWERLAEFGTSELISLPKPTSRDRWYGWPDWLSAAPMIELASSMTQHSFDYFLNRGVPEFMLFLTGGMVDKNAFADLEKQLKAHIGLGNSFKSSVFNFANSELNIQLEKLGVDNGMVGPEFSAQHETVALSIVTAHRVPPLLAGIQTPGKLGATNELPNALMAFQTLIIGQAQNSLSAVMNRTLANPEVNGGLSLSSDDFELNTIVDEFDLQAMDTMGRMQEPVTGSNRDLSQGLLQRGGERSKVAQ